MIFYIKATFSTPNAFQVHVLDRFWCQILLFVLRFLLASCFAALLFIISLYYLIIFAVPKRELRAFYLSRMALFQVGIMFVFQNRTISKNEINIKSP